MIHKVRFFHQHTPETCGISCLLMVLDSFGIDYPTIKKEQILYNRYRIEEYPGIQGAAIAHELAAHGLAVSLVHSSNKLIENKNHYFSPGLYNAILKNHLSYIERSDRVFEVKCGTTITCDDLRRELSQGWLVIVQCIVDGNADGIHQRVLHGILVYGFEGDTFYICDPSYRKATLTAEELTAYMDTPAGQMYIAAGRRANSNYPIGAIRTLLNEDCLLARYYPLIPYKETLIDHLGKTDCRTKAKCLCLTDEALLEAGLPNLDMVQLFRHFLKLYDINPAKLKEIGSFCVDGYEKQMYEDLYNLPGVKKTRAMLYVKAGYRSLGAIAYTTPQEMIARTKRVILEKGLDCKPPFEKEAKTHIAVAKAFTGMVEK